MTPVEKLAVFNADDFGYSRGINRGIVEAHARGVVTSTSLMTNGVAVQEAVSLARQHPRLAVGLHVNFTNEAQRLVDLDDLAACRTELRRQYQLFLDLLDRKPTHLDSHQHVHRHPQRRRLFEELADSEGLPLRDRPPVVFKGGFYAQWEYGVSDPDKVSVAALERIVRCELSAGCYEFCCHPGYYDPALDAVYHRDRELELRTLTDPRVRDVLEQEQVRLVSHADLGLLRQREWREQAS